MICDLPLHHEDRRRLRQDEVSVAGADYGDGARALSSDGLGHLDRAGVAKDFADGAGVRFRLRS